MNVHGIKRKIVRIHLVFCNIASDFFCCVCKKLIPKKRIDSYFLTIEHSFKGRKLCLRSEPSASILVNWKGTIINFFYLDKFLLHTNHHLNADLWVRRKSLHQKKTNALLPANSVFQPNYKRFNVIAVCSTCTFTASIMVCENCEYRDYPPIASACAKDSRMLRSSKKYPRMEPQTIRLRP